MIRGFGARMPWPEALGRFRRFAALYGLIGL